MADTSPSVNFVDKSTVIQAGWANALDRLMFDLLGGPETLVELRQALAGVLQDLDTLGAPAAANKILVSSGVGAFSYYDFLDEDAMGSNSATAAASQQSIKAYVDTVDVANSVTDQAYTDTQVATKASPGFVIAMVLALGG